MFILPFTYRNPNLATCYFTLLQGGPAAVLSESAWLLDGVGVDWSGSAPIMIL